MKYYIFYVVPRRGRRNLFMPSFRKSFAYAKCESRKPLAIFGKVE
jgi:hypothetical protein